MRARGAAGRRRPRGVQPQGRPGAGRGDQIPGLQRPQAAGGRRPGRHLFRAHGMRRRRAGCALPAADAGRAALAGDHQDPPPRLDVEHEARRHGRGGHRDRRARADPRQPHPTGCLGGDGGEEGGRLLRARDADGRGPQAHDRPRPGRDVMHDDASAAAALLTPEAVRERSHELYALGLDNRLQGWVVQPEAMAATADLVAEVVRANYPDLRVPYHARWRHFLPDGADRLASLSARTGEDPAALLRARIDLAIVSVLLDAGAGMAWRYRDAATGKDYARSEGLAMASLALFAEGAFADDGASPRVDAGRLRGMTAAELGQGLQVRPDNPLTGLEGRAALLRRLGETLAVAPQVFGRFHTPRPSGLIDGLVEQLEEDALPARTILIALLRHLGPIWPGRETLDG